jgi:hypothetical protein
VEDLNSNLNLNLNLILNLPVTECADLCRDGVRSGNGNRKVRASAAVVVHHRQRFPVHQSWVARNFRSSDTQPVVPQVRINHYGYRVRDGVDSRSDIQLLDDYAGFWRKGQCEDYHVVGVSGSSSASTRRSLVPCVNLSFLPCL